MQVIRHDDPRSFRAAVEEYLLQGEPRHNLILGIVATLIERPGVYTDLANPTSNAIYAKVGYRVIGDAALITLDTPSA